MSTRQPELQVRTSMKNLAWFVKAMVVALGAAVGVIARTDDARAQADADMEQIKTTLRDAVLAETRAMVAAGQILTVVMPLEGQRLYRLDGIDVGGALVLTRFLLSYRLPSLGRRA